eukprot:Nk52_evm12s360 gene=Nk52_evmTU12s360
MQRGGVDIAEFGEKRLTVTGVVLTSDASGKDAFTLMGSLSLYADHVLFTYEEGAYVIPFMSIDSVEKKKSQVSVSLNVKCKDFSLYSFILPSESECDALSSPLRRLIFPSEFKKLYPFVYESPIKPENDFGWRMFNMADEFKRMGLPNSEWKITVVNAGFEVCEEYPEVLVIPAPLTDKLVIASSRFRSGRQFPALTYFHSSNGSCLVRCGMPRVGTGNDPLRNFEDEQFFHAIFETGGEGEGISLVLDARTPSSKYKGTVESKEFYQFNRSEFLGVEGITGLRERLFKLADICRNHSIGSSQFYSSLGSCGWLNVVQNYLVASVYVARLLNRKKARIVLHSDDDGDSSAIISSIAQLLLDPYFRTFKGFQMLIEKEWLHFGHHFSDRFSHFGRIGTKLRNNSPVFILFLDCVWQILGQFPSAFEFNELFLIFLGHNASFSTFGTFLLNNQKERVQHNIKRYTTSLWSHINGSDVSRQYQSLLFSPSSRVLIPNCSGQSINIWSRMYCPSISKLSVNNCEEIRIARKVGRLLKLEEQLRRVKSRGIGLGSFSHGPAESSLNSSAGNIISVGNITNSVESLHVEAPTENEAPPQCEECKSPLCLCGL